MLAHLLASLEDVAPLEVAAHVLQPASARGKGGLDELFDQTRAILSMTDERPEERFGTQLAFNLLPWNASTPALGSQLEAVLPWELDARVQLSQAGVFHGCTAGVFLKTSTPLESSALTDRLLDRPLVEAAPAPEYLGPVVAASHDKILVGAVTTTGGRGHWLWCCADNLSLSAGNAVALAGS
jgi:aspartate-semialdehyde dehydrogenase